MKWVFLACTIALVCTIALTSVVIVGCSADAEIDVPVWPADAGADAERPSQPDAEPVGEASLTGGG